MDDINIESTLNYIEKLDKKIIDEIDSITFENDGLSKGRVKAEIMTFRGDYSDYEWG